MTAAQSIPFQPNDILADIGDTCRRRVLFILSKHTWLFDMDDSLAWPALESTSLLADQVNAGELRIVKASISKTVSDKAMDRARTKLKRFSPALALKAELATRAGRGRAYALFDDDPTMTRRTFDRALREWWAGGMRMMSFIPHWDRCGVRSINIKDLDQVPLREAKAHAVTYALSLGETSLDRPESLPDCTAKGFPRVRQAPPAAALFRVDRQILRVFWEYYQWKLAKPGRSLSDAKREMESEVFRTENADGSYTTLRPSQLPSERTFRHWFYILIDHKTRRIGQVGEKEYQTNEREVLGDEKSKVQRAGEVCSGDATIWNISIVSRFEGRRVVGCPVVFRIRCKRTGMLIGLSVSLATASWTGMAAAISNCLEDKVEFCRRYGIAITPDQWPIQGLMGTLEVDRGETDNHHPNAFIEMTGVTVTNLPGGRPDMKPGVESDWHTLQVRMNGKTPSALVKTWEKAQNSKWKLEGTLDIDQFTKILIRHELDRMKKSRPEVLLDPEMTAVGLNSSPLHMWDYSVRYEGASLSHHDLDEVQLSLLRRETASLTDRGVYFKGCYYVADSLLKEHAFARARRKGNAKVRIAYEARLVDRIYVLEIASKALDDPIVCELNSALNSQRSYFGKCFAEIAELLRQQTINDANNAPEEHRSAHTTLRAHNETVAESLDQAAKSPRTGESIAQQLKSMPENRKDETFLTEPLQAFQPRVGAQAGGAGDTEATGSAGHRSAPPPTEPVVQRDSKPASPGKAAAVPADEEEDEAFSLYLRT